MSATDLVASSTAPFLLQDLPNEAVELIAQYASTPSTPAACLLPMVCRGWREATGRAELLVDISLDLAPAYLLPGCSSDHYELQWELQQALTSAGAAAAAVPAVPSGLLRAGRLAAWLAKYSSSVRSLCIPGAGDYYNVGPAWPVHLRSMRGALTAGQGAGSSSPLPHLVQLELPIMKIPGTGAFLLGLSKHCPSLQRLVLKEGATWRYSRGCSGDELSDQGPDDLPQHGKPIDVGLLSRAVAPLTCLRVLRVEWSPNLDVEGSSMAGLLRVLPATLEDMQLDNVVCKGSIPLSCITHLVNLRGWDERPLVRLVVDDSSSSGSGVGSSSTSASGAAALTALTRLRVHFTLFKEDARLQLPSLRILDAGYYIEPAAWQQLQGMQHLRQLRASSFAVEHACSYDTFRDGRVGPLWQGAQGAAGLGGMTQLQELVLESMHTDYHLQLSMSAPWAAAVAKLTQLTALDLYEHVMVAGASTMLAPLTQLKALTVQCYDQLPLEYFGQLPQEYVDQLPQAYFDQLPQEYYPDGEGWAATTAGAVVQAVAAAVQGGRGQLQQLVLVLPYEQAQQGGTQKVQLAAMASLPGLLVEVLDEYAYEQTRRPVT